MEVVAADPGIRTLSRGLSILEMLGSADEGRSLSEIAEATSLSVATTHRLLRTLAVHGYVEQDPRSRWYSLGFKVLDLRGASVTHAIRMAADLHPLIRALSVKAAQRSHLAVYSGGHVIYIDRVDARENPGGYVPVGLKAPAHSTGLGKALLAFLPDSQIDAFLRTPLHSYTATTVTDPDALRAEFDLIRQRGYAVDHGEFNDQISCIGAPVFDYSARAVAAVSVAGTPADMLPNEAVLARHVMATAFEASSRLGFRPADGYAPDVLAKAAANNLRGR